MRSLRLRTMLATIAVLLLAAPVAYAQQRTEVVVRSGAPDSGKVIESYVSLRAPLPSSAPAHPAACDRIGYLRFRRARPAQRRTPTGRRSPAFTGQARAPKPSQADAVVTGMPGFLGGASSFDQVARNVVTQGAKQGRNVEFWAIDRRANCLEDHRGVQAAAAARDPLVALRYYFAGAEVGGRRFAGFKTSEEVPYLADFGLERTVRDMRTVLVREMPLRRDRARKIVCGGHSLGGPLTAAFAAWDFDGDASTTGDAGYNQCAGFYGLDTQLAIGPDTPSGTPGVNALGEALLAQGGQGRFIDAPPATPETLQILGPSGVAAFFLPNQETNFFSEVPRTPRIETSLRLLFSRNAVEFATGTPSVRDFRLTGLPLIGGVFDDNSSPISIFRSSVGVFDGGPVTEKQFPLPGPVALLTGDDRLMAPAEPNGPLYTWRNYDKVGIAGAPDQRTSTGEPFTSRASEVSSVVQLARNQFEAPADFTEQYFPTRITADVSAAQAGDRSGDLEDLRYTEVALRNSLLIQGGDGIGQPNGEGAERTVVIPGYNHLDVTTAAAAQNDGRRERTSFELARLALQATR